MSARSAAAPGRTPPGEGRSPASSASASTVRNGRPERHRVDAARRARPLPASFVQLRNSTQAPLRFCQRLRRADMHPHALHAHAVGPASRDRLVPDHVEREGALRAALEQARMRQRHARERERHDLLLEPAPADAPVGIQREVAAPLVAVARRGERQQQQAVHARVVPGPGEAGQVGADALDPHRVGSCGSRTARRPSRGRAFLTPPPVSSRAARSSEISIGGALRLLRCRSIWSAL